MPHITHPAGSTADQVCFDRETRRALPSKMSTSLSKTSRKKSSTFDRNAIFDMCDKPSLFDELQTCIQVGDNLGFLHAVVTKAVVAIDFCTVFETKPRDILEF